MSNVVHPVQLRLRAAVAAHGDKVAYVTEVGFREV